MKIFLTGGTGVLGTRALPRLVEAGHEVTAVARTDAKGARVAELGGAPVRCDLFDPVAVEAAVAGHEAVVHLATHIPPFFRAARTSSWATNDRLRREASRHLVDAALAAGAGRYVQESICFPYVDSGEAWVDEDVPRTENALTASMCDAERSAARFGDGRGEAVVLRFAQFTSDDSEHVAAFHTLARRRIPPLPGDPSSYTSFIHADDAATAVVAAIDVAPGTYNIGDDEPLTRGEANRVIADAIGAAPPIRVPSALLRLAPEKLRYLTRSLRVSNRRFREATSWSPTHPSIRQAWPTVVSP